MEYLQLFDDNKNALNEKVLREDKKNLPKGKNFMIILIFIQNSEGKFLIQKTNIQKDGLYAVTGGHVTFGDDSLKTVIKEVKEELGITLDKDEIEYVDCIKYKFCFCDIYYCKKDLNIDDLTLQEEEVDSINWLSTKEIYDLINNNLFRKSNLEPIEKLLKYIEK